MLEIIILILAIVATASIIALFYILKEGQKKDAMHLQQSTEAIQKNEELRGALEQKNLDYVALDSRFQALSERIAQEREEHIEKQKELKEQLELVGNEMINKGTKLLRSENSEQLIALLSPFKDKLASFEKEIRENNQKGIERFAAMDAVVKSLSEQHAKMNSTAQNLVDALRGEQKVQGDWGELALERILESSGLEKGREYEVQSSFKDENGNHLRPDVIINLPDDKHIIVDSKVSLKAFEQYINSDSVELKKQALSNHLISIKTHVKQLGEKNYNHINGLTSPDFVLMFIPLESSFALAIKEEPDIYQLAWEKKVVLVTPSTLLATLKTVGSIWKQEKQNKNALEIANQAARLFDKFHGFITDMEKIGQKQKDARDAYDQAMNKLTNGKGNLITSAQKLKDLGIKSKKDLDQKYLGDSEIE